MRTVHVAAQRPYDVWIERGLMEEAGRLIKSTLGKTCRAAILTDDTVDALYGAQVEGALAREGFQVCRYAIAHGEEHKNLTTWAGMLEFLAARQLTRSDVIVALGGGVVGDLAGFAAASFLRGIPLVQMPTTLLAMVDSSVGGKTGLNLSSGKNLAGAFYQPSLVLCDPDALWTLQPHQLADGVAEVIKYGVLGDAELFERLREGKWHADMLDVIQTCVAAKARLVEGDERDTGKRQLLNLGHTLGHAIEKCSEYAISHGHAVGIGMVYAARLSHQLGLCDEGVEERLTECLKANQLPVDAPYTAQALCEAALSDKKRMDDSITFVLPVQIGRCELRSMKVAELSRLVQLAVGK